MIIQALTNRELALLDTGLLNRPRRAIEAWMGIKAERWAVCARDDQAQCIGLLLAHKIEQKVVCTAIEISPTYPNDTLTYALVNALCDAVDGLEPSAVGTSLSQANKGVLEALQVMGTDIPTRRSLTTSGPSHNAA